MEIKNVLSLTPVQMLDRIEAAGVVLSCDGSILAAESPNASGVGLSGARLDYLEANQYVLVALLKLRALFPGEQLQEISGLFGDGLAAVARMESNKITQYVKARKANGAGC